MTKRYQVVGECAHVVVTDVSGVSAMNLLYKGAFLPDGVDEKRLKHLLDSRLVAEVKDGGEIAPNAAVAQDPTVGIPTVGPADAGAGHADDPGEQPVTSAEDQEADRRRAEARAQLPADGSAPDGRKPDAVFVEYLVGKGYDRGEVEKADRNQLKKLIADVK